MTVKRYTPTQCCEYDGTYVTYSDYQKLVAEGEAMREALSGVLTHCPINDPDIDKACAAMICNDALQSTPNTDAAIADIGANAVDKFAEYIVSSNRTLQNLYCEMQAISYAHDMRKRATDKEIMEVIDSMGGSGNKAARRAANLRAGRKG